MHSKKQKKPNYWTDTEFHNASPDARCLYNKVNKNGGLGIILLLVLNVFRKFIYGVPVIVLLIATGYIVSIVFCVKALIYAFRLKKLYLEYKK